MNISVRNLLRIGLIVLIALMTISMPNKTKQVIKQIIAQEKGEGTLDNKLLNEVVGQIDEVNLSTDEAFVLGFVKYQEGDEQNAKRYLYQASKSKNEYIRLYAAIDLIKILLTEGEKSEAIAFVGNMLVDFSGKIYNEESSAVVDLIQDIVYVEEGNKTLIESLEQVLEETSGLTLETKCDIKIKIGILYVYNGNYARGMEKFLEVMAAAENMTNKFYGAKAQVSLGATYGLLGDYEEAKYHFRYALDIPITNPEDSAYIKTYAAINLYENMLYEADYNDVEEIQQAVLKYTQYLPKELYESIMAMGEISRCNYYLKLQEVERAEEILNNIEINIKGIEKDTYLSIHTNYLLAKAELMYLKGDLQESIHIYKTLVEENNKQFMKYILNRLVNILDEQGDYEEANKYEIKLRQFYDQEAIVVNMDYSDYALYKYEYQKQLLEEAHLKMKRYLQIIIIASVICIIMRLVWINNKRLIQVNRLDGLANVYNRRYFEEYYRKLQGQTHPFAMIIFDIDYFKSINDVYGHLVGDQVIKGVVNLSKEVIGKSGKLFRYGGEEFVAIIENKPIEEVRDIAENIRQCIEAHAWENEMKVTVSLGVKESTSEMRDILDSADQNLYIAKEQGRNKVI